jgi:hypothetical protein
MASHGNKVQPPAAASAGGRCVLRVHAHEQRYSKESADGEGHFAAFFFSPLVDADP